MWTITSTRHTPKNLVSPPLSPWQVSWPSIPEAQIMLSVRNFFGTEPHCSLEKVVTVAVCITLGNCSGRSAVSDPQPLICPLTPTSEPSSLWGRQAGKRRSLKTISRSTVITAKSLSKSNSSLVGVYKRTSTTFHLGSCSKQNKANIYCIKNGLNLDNKWP